MNFTKDIKTIEFKSEDDGFCNVIIGSPSMQIHVESKIPYQSTLEGLVVKDTY